MIQSVTSKALHQTAPVSDISSKYETLSKQAKEIFEKQKETVNLHQNFIDASQTVYEWIRVSTSSYYIKISMIISFGIFF
jgi:nesprin-1